jgi:hypothetical protein
LESFTRTLQRVPDFNVESLRKARGTPLAALIVRSIKISQSWRYFAMVMKTTEQVGGGHRSMRPEDIHARRAEERGAQFEWHYGRVTRLGNFEVVGGSREVTIIWEEGGITSQQSNISDEQWEILKLAFQTSGRIAVLSDKKDEGWMYDYRFLEAVR